MDLLNAIGFLGTLLGIYSFVKNDMPLFSLFKKNLFLTRGALPYGSREGAVAFLKS